MIKKLRMKIQFLIKLNQLFDRNERRHFIVIMAVVLIMSIFQTLGVASVLPFISLVMNPEIIFKHEKLLWLFNFFQFTDTRSFIVTAGFVMLGIIITGNLISALAIWMRNRFVWSKSHDLSTALLRKYLSMPYASFVSKNSADLGKNVLAEVQELTGYVMIPILEILSYLVLIIFIFFALWIVSPIIAMAVFLVFCIFYGGIYQAVLGRKLKTKGDSRFKMNRARFKSVFESLGGIKEIKVLGREGFFLNKFMVHSRQFCDLRSWKDTIAQLPRYFIEIMSSGGVIVFILFLVLSGKNVLQIIPVVSFLVFAGYKLMPVINKMFQAFSQLQFNQVTLDKIHGDLIQEPWDETSPESGPEIVFRKEIDFRNISFSYPGKRSFKLNNINISIKKNTSVAITGPTGCGKTTLVDIALGLLVPEKGVIEIDGVSIDDSKIRSWQKQLGYVPQHIYLLDDSIRSNIAIGIQPEFIDQKKVEKAAIIAGLHDFICEGLPRGYDTVVGERGVRLSGGQRQRVGIARALYHDPDVLVFDEATSSLDGVTEEAVLTAIEKISKLKTMLVIAHRLTTVKQCDMIYLLDNGCIVASGTYQDLMENNPQFRAMAGEMKA